MTLPDKPQTPAGAYWDSLVKNERPTAKPGDPDFKGTLRPRTKAWLIGVIAVALFIGWMVNSANHSRTATATPGPGFYSVSQSDALFLNTLTQSGVPYGNAAVAISVGKDVGQLYDQGYSSEQLVAQYQLADAQLDTAYTPQQMRQLVYAGIRHYATRR
jgi:hypothetical protein